MSDGFTRAAVVAQLETIRERVKYGRASGIPSESSIKNAEDAIRRNDYIRRYHEFREKALGDIEFLLELVMK